MTDEKIKINIPNSPFTGNRTYSSLFLPPAFNIPFDSTLAAYLVNTYIDDAGLKHSFKRPYFVLLQANDISENFKELDRELKENQYFVYDYYVGSNEDGSMLFMYVFECPNELRTDYDKFLKGEYSKFSANFKSRFAKIVPDIHGKYIQSPLYGVLYKTPEWKKKIEGIICDPNENEHLDANQEFFGKPEEKFEIFRYV